MKTIGLDIGTTSIGIVVADTENKTVIDSKTVESNSFIDSKPGERIQNVDTIVSKAMCLINDMLEKHTDISAIGLTGQMHGIIYTNADGKAVSPLITWQDMRGEKTAEEIKEKFGIGAAAGYGLISHIENIKNKEVPADAVKICTVGDYIGMVLTGRKEPLIHTGNAASLGLFNSKTFKFRKEIIEALGADVSVLPETTKEICEIGKYKGIPVLVSLGDNQASFLGAVGTRKNICQINVGTGGQISVLSDEFFETEGIEARPYIGDSYILTGAALCSGRAYAILEKFFRSYAKAVGSDGPQYDIMAALAEDADKNSGLVTDTRFMGTRTRPDIKGSVTKVTEDNFTPANLIYSWLCGMADELLSLCERIEEGSDIKINCFMGSGNGLRKNKTLREIFTEKTNDGFSMGEAREEAAFGAAVSACYADFSKGI